MIYNTLRQFVQNHARDSLFPLVEAATLFTIDMAPHVSLAKTWDAQKQAHVMQGFELPYLVTGIEDRAGCVILAERPHLMRGLWAERVFVDCLPADAMTDVGAYGDDIDQKLLYRETQDMPPGSVIVSLGTITTMGISEGGFVVGGTLHQVLMGTPGKLNLKLDGINATNPLVAPLYGTALKNAMTAIEEIVHVEGLPGFTGWPQDEHAIRYGVFEIGQDGSIVVSDRYNR